MKITLQNNYSILSYFYLCATFELFPLDTELKKELIIEDMKHFRIWCLQKKVCSHLYEK